MKVKPCPHCDNYKFFINTDTGDLVCDECDGIMVPASPQAAEAKGSAEFNCSIARVKGNTKFSYVNVVGKGCEGWLNLFFGEYCIALIQDIEFADMLRKELNEKQ